MAAQTEATVLAIPQPVAVRLPRRYLIVKRAVDIVLSAALLVLASPAMLLIALAIKVSSPGPAIFRQARVGLSGRTFTIVKFRTMYIAAPANSYKLSSDDPVVTRIGRILRQSGLDELPQLWNVIRGDMSLIGPRPEVQRIAIERGFVDHPRHLVRPGITGWWQIHHRNDEPLHEHLEYDLEYLARLSFAFDALIALMTVRHIARSAYRAIASRTDRAT